MKNMNDKKAQSKNTQSENIQSMNNSAGNKSGNSRMFALVGVTLLALSTLSFIAGCDNDNIVAFDEAPPAPQGVFTVRGDDTVFVYWLPVEAADFDHYAIYSAFDSTNGTVFTLIGTSATEEFIDVDVVNGTRYFYAVTAVDFAGNESLESAEWGGATPRFQSREVLLISNVSPSNSGFNFASGSPVAFNSPAADIWIDRDSLGILFINVDSIPDTLMGDIQDMGFTDNFDEIGRAPLEGWSALGFAELILGHTYIIWTQDDRYAKVRINEIGSNFVIIDYAYQSGTAIAGDGGEPELVAPNGDIIDASDFDRSSGAHRTDNSVRPKQGKMSVVQ
jgi:hypothetical protein